MMTFALPQIVLGIALAGLVSLMVVQLRMTRRRVRREWHDLVASLQKVDFAGITTVAVDYMTPTRGQVNMEPDRIWELLGGYDGLRKMRENAELMLELAAYAQQWNFDEAVIVTERMRRDAISLRQAVRRVEFGMLPFGLTKHLRVTMPMYAQEASSAYYLMRQRLLSLYETSHECRLPALAACL